MTQAARRKSSLTGANPVAPAAEDRAQPTPEPVATEQPVHPAEGGPRPRKYPPKVSFYQDPEDTARVRGAILHTQLTEGSRSLSAFINHAVMAEVERLEAKYNGGKPFPAIGAREMPQGRPMGE